MSVLVTNYIQANSIHISLYKKVLYKALGFFILSSSTTFFPYSIKQLSCSHIFRFRCAIAWAVCGNAMTKHKNQAMWKKNFQFSSLQGHFTWSEQEILQEGQAIVRHNQAPWLDENRHLKWESQQYIPSSSSHTFSESCERRKGFFGVLTNQVVDDRSVSCRCELFRFPAWKFMLIQFWHFSVYSVKLML